MANKEQLVRDFTEALKNIESGEQIVQVYDDGDEHIAVSMELDSWRGKEYFVMGLKGYSDGEVIDDRAYMMLDRELVNEAFNEHGGIEGTVELIAGIISAKTESSKPDEEGVPAE